MGLRNYFRKQLSTVIEWNDQNPNTLLFQYPSLTDEIKNASKLIIAPGQACIVVYEGKVERVLMETGTFMLETDNHPFVTSLLKLRQNFESEHKLRIYFFRTAEIVHQKWGTATPIKYVDAVYQFPIALSAYGNYSVKLIDAQHLFENLLGARQSFSTSDLQQWIIGRISPELSSYLAQSKYSYQNIDAHLVDISKALTEILGPIAASFGMQLSDFRIEATSFDKDTQTRIAKISNMTTEALSAAEVGLNYVELEKLRALLDAAQNEGGLAGAGLQLGVGMELGKTVLANTNNQTSSDQHIDQLRTLKLLLDEGVLTQQEFDDKKKDILNRI